MLAPVCNTVPIFPAIGSGVISFMNTGQTAKKHPQLIPTNNLPVRKNVVYGIIVTNEATINKIFA